MNVSSYSYQESYLFDAELEFFPMYTLLQRALIGLVW